MMAGEDDVQSKHKTLEYDVSLGWYFQDDVTATIKGREFELVKILTLFTSIDLSRNNLEGEIPEVMGDLTLLYVLNLSGNGFTGHIPSSLGQLRQLESLDLSTNKLSGEIPTQLASLNFLSVLNLSFNQLRIMGLPLNPSCKDATPPPAFESRHSGSRMEIDWDYVAPEIGFVTGLGIVIWPLVFCKRWRRCYYEHVDGILSRILRS
ncbi:Receptor like protein 42 [Vitis vinifera]|uniref:Receptor like protein 42 n=1 Tax=Vitis vinifera TaxID=29760 RepID=A0A438BRW0_VITVI|nr:Receptor like protein 42 [Vitis vinifera]